MNEKYMKLNSVRAACVADNRNMHTRNSHNLLIKP